MEEWRVEWWNQFYSIVTRPSRKDQEGFHNKAISMCSL